MWNYAVPVYGRRALPTRPRSPEDVEGGDVVQPEESFGLRPLSPLEGHILQAVEGGPVGRVNAQDLPEGLLRISGGYGTATGEFYVGYAGSPGESGVRESPVAEGVVPS